MRHCIIHGELQLIQQVVKDIYNKLFFSRFIQLPAHSLGNIYIADTINNRIRKVTVSTGIITTIAGTGTTTYSGDNGPATSAALNYPGRVNVDSSGKPTVVNNFIIYSVFMHSLTR